MNVMQASTGSAPRAGAQIGRFVLIDVLGRGAQATVWRANDQRLDRQVALKLLAPGAQSVSVHQWLHEARAVSRLSHPNIVPVFEADEADGQSYLVFELVAGHTLTEALRRSGAMPARAAAALLRGVLEALRAAHAQGIVHRDLKPSNILLGPDGRARVMDFGIAARASDGAGHICGTPGYMSPEAAQGRAPTPAMDVFAAGMILGELLSGRALLVERDAQLALQRTIAEDVVLPDAVAIDAGLRGIVLRAVARDAATRFDSAAAMAAALDAWLGTGDAAAAAASASHGTVDFLLRRMRHKSDFPALSDAVVRIQRVAASDNESLNSLAAEILKDVALTHKLLRLVNSASFRHAGGGTISTVSRAIALIGFAGVRNMALSLVLLDHMNDKQHAAQLKEQFLCALMAGQLAGELSQARDSEESYLGALLHNLGRLLAEFYLPEEASAIRDELRPHAARTGDAQPSAEQASQRVLGVGFQQLGIAVARAWGLPESLQQCMRSPEGAPPARRLESSPERARWLARACNEMAEAVTRNDGTAAARLEGLAAGYAAALGVAPRDLMQAVQTSRTKLRGLADAIGLKLPEDSPAQRLMERSCATSNDVGASANAPAQANEPTLVMAPPASLPPVRRRSVMPDRESRKSSVS